MSKISKLMTAVVAGSVLVGGMANAQEEAPELTEEEQQTLEKAWEMSACFQAIDTMSDKEMEAKVEAQVQEWRDKAPRQIERVRAQLKEKYARSTDKQIEMMVDGKLEQSAFNEIKKVARNECTSKVGIDDLNAFQRDIMAIVDKHGQGVLQPKQK